MAQRRYEDLIQLQWTNELRPIAAAPSVSMGPTLPTESAEEVIGPADLLRINVANAFADSPIDSAYVVEPMGTVALGPIYGRVNVAGMSVLEAEEAIKEQLAKLFEDPQVQVTMAEKRSGLAPTSSALPTESASRPLPDTFTRRPLPDEIQQAIAQELSALRQSVDVLREENATLKKRIEQLRPTSTTQPH
jgi:protein involved in polysaccharide export with SLBB domain